ncbi:M20/M25/M40 family metallo-hydrolase [Sphingomicrobium flavum]|uniref:M20/M25/M40 family metallo-hydrolase n=1 Tax=Sphingomicrobium flavum TaxID=1229164 RepID=UPI0021AD5ED9|nr:M20/M25/M40 family metallo-hydrolase [Sphingomicrobium flavum]
MTLRLLLALSALLFALPAAAQLSAPEQRMIDTVAAEQQRTLDLLERLVEQNSGTMNHEGVREVGRIMAAEFEAIGFTTQWVEAPGTDRAGHLVARHEGSATGQRLLLIGHLDTVFEPDSPFQSFTIEGDKAIGPGVGDNKGGITVMIAALRAMQAAGTLADANIIAVLTGDEEDAGEPVAAARAVLVAAAEVSDIALDYEGLSRGDDGEDMGSIARRSSSAWTLEVRADSGHSSGVFSEARGYGAIFEAARIIDEYRRVLRLAEPELTFNVGLIAGGEEAALDTDKIRATARGKTNIIAPIALARGDLRAIDQGQIDRTIARMQAITAQSLPGTSASLSFDPVTYPPMAPTAANQALLDRLNMVNADLGLAAMAPLDPMKRGAADISFVAHLVPGINGMGALGEGSHAPGESVDIPALWRQANRAAILMTRLTAEPR